MAHNAAVNSTEVKTTRNSN